MTENLDFVPPFNLSRAVARVEGDLKRRWQQVLKATAFVGGEEVAAFESAFSRYLGSAFCVGVGNGTDALELALRALGAGPGDEVIVPDFTFIATASAVVLVGATPVFADIDPETLNLDAQSAARCVSDRTVGIIGVHLYGRPFDLDGVGRLCRDRDLWLIEDAAQAHGATWRGQRVGNFGEFATWSFYPSKNLGCFGDGGAVTSREASKEERIRSLANHGRAEHYFHREIGLNSRLDGLQAAVLNSRLSSLEEDNARRIAIAGRYREALQGLAGVKVLRDREDERCVYHQFTLLASKRDDLRDFLLGKGIGTGIHYPHAVHQQPAFEGSAKTPVELSVSTAAAEEVLCLPMFPEMTDAEVNRVCQALQEFSG